MQNYIASTHWIATLALMALYLILAIRFFQKKNNDITALDSGLTQIARFGFMLVYITGLFMSVTLGRLVHNAHHVISLLPVLVIFGIRFLPTFTKKENSATTYAWMFIFMFILMLIVGITSKLSILPTL